MIYKAFLNRQEITGFPVKGKDTKEIWGGNTLLWRKEKREVLTVSGIHAYSLIFTNGSQTFAKIMFSDTNGNTKDAIASFSSKKPCFTPLYILDKPSYGERYLHTERFSAEENGYMCVTETTAYTNEDRSHELSLHITIRGFKSGSNFVSPTCVINAGENEYYSHTKIVWQNHGHIYYYTSRYTGETRQWHQVIFKIDFNGTIVEKYETSSSNLSKILNIYASYSTIYSGSRTFLIPMSQIYNICELKSNIFAPEKVSAPGEYVGRTNQKHIFIDFWSTGKKTCNIYKFVNGEFVKIRETETNLRRLFTTVYNNHLIYYTLRENGIQVLDLGDLETGTDSDVKEISDILPASSSMGAELTFAQNGYLYILYRNGAETANNIYLKTHRMFVIPL
jgi:hypothetical protein